MEQQPEDNPLVGEAAVAGKPVEVYATGAFTGHGSLGGGRGLAKAIEQAMTEAVLQANAEGLSAQDHPDEIRARMMVARERVLQEEA